MKEDLKALEDKHADLKIELETTKQQSERPKTASPAKKKRKAEEDVIPVPRSPKKQKQDASKSNADELTVEVSLSDLGEIGTFPPSHDLIALLTMTGNMLLRSFYQIRIHLKSHDKTEPRILAHYLIKAASALPQVVQKAVDSQQSAINVDLDFLKSVVTAADRSNGLLIAGISRISYVADGAEATGHVVYSYVQMYQRLLDCLQMLSVFEATRMAGEERKADASRRSSPSKSKTKQPKQTNIEESAALSLMTNFLCRTVDGLDSKIDAHKSVFEGFTYVALDKLGGKLYHLVFGHERGPTIEDEIAASNDSDEIGDAVDTGTLTQREQQMRAAKLEAPYLIHLLNRIMNAAPAHLDAVVKHNNGKPKQACKGSMKGAIAVAAKERLQRTLVNAVFGEESNAGDDLFKDCLRMPSISGPLPMPKAKEPDIQEWFKEELWRLLGWEILSRDSEWV